MLWAAHDYSTADFNDARLTQRFISLISNLADQPGKSLPEALGSWSESKAAYRFFDNDKVTPDAIYDADRKVTLDKIQHHPVILAVQDTTSFNFTSHPETKGLGPIGSTPGLSGFYLHSCLCVSTDGIPLGTLGRRLWVRPPEGKNSRKTHKNLPIEDKESFRWIDVTREVAEVVPATTKVIMVGDRESDIFDLFLLATSNHYDILVRAAWDRCLDQSNDHLWQAVEKTAELGRTTINIPQADERPERTATLALKTVTVPLMPPRSRKSEKLPVVSLNALLIREVDPPDDEEPIEWMLLTTLPVATLEDGLQLLTWYTYRWRIERYHYTLKSGCQVEKLQLETAERLMRALAVFSIVALRLLSLTYHARQSPNEPCTVVLSESEWKALYAAKHKTSTVPSVPPDLKTAVLWIAKLGGFLARKSDGQPGVKVLWRGFRRLQDMTEMWDLFHPKTCG